MQDKNAEPDRYLELVRTLANLTHSLVFICSVNHFKPLFFNDSAQWFFKTRPSALRRVLKEIAGRKTELTEHTITWKIELPGNHGNAPEDIRYFTVESYSILWSDEMAVVSIMIDDTERKRKEDRIYRVIYTDPLTGLKNRKYAMDTMKLLIENGTAFVLSFVGVDDLKLCDETLGLKAGDDYLTEISNALRALGGEVCRAGRDKFIIIRKDLPLEAQNDRLESLRLMVRKNGELRDHPRSFSYASCMVPAYTDKKPDDYIQLVDAMMYDYKLAHRKTMNANNAKE